MKTDLATTVITAIIGFIVAFFVCNFILPEIPAVSFKEIDSNITYELAEPDVNVFNFRAINPTVEVYVGSQEEEKEEEKEEAPAGDDTQNEGETPNGSSD